MHNIIFAWIITNEVLSNGSFNNVTAAGLEDSYGNIVQTRVEIMWRNNYRTCARVKCRFFSFLMLFVKPRVEICQILIERNRGNGGEIVGRATGIRSYGSLWYFITITAINIARVRGDNPVKRTWRVYLPAIKRSSSKKKNKIYPWDIRVRKKKDFRKNTVDTFFSKNRLVWTDQFCRSQSKVFSEFDKRYEIIIRIQDDHPFDLWAKRKLC